MNGTVRMGRPGFTLIELLIVIAIIGVLMSMMTPALRHAQAMAHSATCTSNLRQLGTALVMYQSEWGCYPAHQWKLGPGGAVRKRWFQQLHEMLDLGEKVQQCPEVAGWVCGRNNSYGYNYKYVGSARVLTDGTFERFPVMQIKNPGRTIAFGDSSGTGWTEPYEPIPFAQKSSIYGYDERKNRVGNHGYTLDPTYIPQRTEDLYSGDKYADKESASFIAPRHLGKANFCMVDGHVESLTPEEVYADNRYWNGYGREDPLDEHVAGKLPRLNERYGW